MKDQATDKRSLIITGALVLTAIFLAAFGWLLSRTQTCPEGWWLWDRLGCLEPNALGDTFAGAFAPVAFVWLVAAVLLQRNELAAQRQELRESRAVAAQQVEEAKKNVELIGIQTSILRDERANKIEKEADEDLNELIGTASEIFVDICSRFSVAIGPLERNAQNEPWESGDGVYSLGGPYIASGAGRLGRISEQILMVSVSVFEAVQQGEEIRYKGVYGFDRLISVLSMIDDLVPKISAPAKAELMRVSAIGSANEAKNLMKYLAKNGINVDELYSPF